MALAPATAAQVEKEKESLRMELNKAKQQVKETEAAVSAQKAELDKLNHIINEADHERIRQKKEYDVVINERDILGACCPRARADYAWLTGRLGGPRTPRSNDRGSGASQARS